MLAKIFLDSIPIHWWGNVCTSRVAIRATPTDVAKMMFNVVRENETAGRPDRWRNEKREGKWLQVSGYSATLWWIKLELGLGLELESGTVTVSSL